jgi:hypothetical protein
MTSDWIRVLKAWNAIRFESAVHIQQQQQQLDESHSHESIRLLWVAP